MCQREKTGEAEQQQGAGLQQAGQEHGDGVSWVCCQRSSVACDWRLLRCCQGAECAERPTLLSALKSFARTLPAELHGGIVVSTLHFLMVRTPMSSRTKIYDRMPMLTVEAAASGVVETIIKQPTRIARPWFVLGSVALAALPGPVTRWSKVGFKWMDRSLAKRAGQPWSSRLCRRSATNGG